MGDEEGFLARWSRRKREEGRATPEAEPATPPVAAPAADEEPELAPEELAKLPALDALTEHTDVTAFLKQGVPKALRNAALRRIWLADPMIRDRVGDALDYAYDYNTPGGVPGFGPLEADLDVGEMVSRLFPQPSDGAERAVLAEEEPAPALPADAREGDEGGRAAGVEPPGQLAPPARRAASEGSLAETETPAEAPEGADPSPEERPRSRPRRHGGAMPL